MSRLKYTAQIAEPYRQAFQSGVTKWYDVQGRDLPWRQVRDPYRIFVSEIMLHQTTVTTVKPVYERFIDRFPTITDVFQASLEDVKRITDPLGYKIRGQWIKQCADVIVSERHGQWPETVDELMELPGIGRYTAGAILSFAFGVDAPILDTNVKRVLGRYFGVNYRDSSAEIQHQLWALAEAVIPLGQAIHFNQALMDFGAMVCTSRRPGCTICPLFKTCAQGEAGPLEAAEEPFTYGHRADNEGKEA